MEIVQPQVDYERDSFRLHVWNSRPLSRGIRRTTPWSYTEESFSSSSATATNQSPLRYVHPHSGSPEHGYDASAEPSPTFRPPTQAYGANAIYSTVRENSPGRMSTREGEEEARSRDRVPSDEDFGGPYERVAFEFPTRTNTPEDTNDAPFYDVADPNRTAIQQRYSPYPTSSHSRRNSGSDQRSASPAPSMASSGSRSSFVQPTLPASIRVTAPPRTKHRKQRLYTVDRRAICQMAQENPHLRQEDIAKEFKIERSTVSKILKEKDRWLSTPQEPAVRVSKYRLAKYPQLEAELKGWIISESANGVIFTDAMIRNKAKELDVKWSYETEGKFKASPGWIENFKARVGIRKGRYTGSGTDEQKALAHGLPAGWTQAWPQQSVPPQQLPNAVLPPDGQVVAVEAVAVGPQPVPQTVSGQSDSTVWQQHQQQAVDTWSQQQGYGVPEAAVAPTYDPTQAPESIPDPPPAYAPPSEGHHPAAQYAVASGAGGSGGGGDDGHSEAYQEAASAGPTEVKIDPRDAMKVVARILFKDDFRRQLSSEEQNMLYNVIRAFHSYLNGNSHRST